MGNCCHNETKNDSEKNMNKKTESRRDIKKVPVHLVIKMQSLIRGFLIRRIIKRIYGFEMSKGLLLRGTVHIEMEPKKLEE